MAEAEESHASTPTLKSENRLMLTPSEQILHSTVMIRCEDSKGNQSSGTGFVFYLFNHNNQNLPVLVSNKHVITGASKGTLTFTESKSDNTPDYGKNISFQITDFEKVWLGHPDPSVDLAILPLVPTLNEIGRNGKKPFFVGLDQSLIPTEDGFRSLTPLEDMLIIGYPDGISDTTNNVPVLRRGISATPVYLDFLGKKEFLIDAAIFPGSSGSPVFLFNQGTWMLRDGTTVGGGFRVQLLGIIYAVALHSADGEVVVIPAPTQARAIAISKIPNNLGLCIKASRILEFEPLLVKQGLVPPDGYKMRTN